MLFFGKNKEYKCFFELIEDKNNKNALSEVVSAATEYGFRGGLWQTFAALLMMKDENAYTLSAERSTAAAEPLSRLAADDFKNLYEYFNWDFGKEHPLSRFFEFENDNARSSFKIGKLASELAEKLASAKNESEFKKIADCFYKKYGAGDFGLNGAFSLKNGDNMCLKPVGRLSDVRFCDLWGYEIQKKELVENTERFLKGESANNVLLCGDSGTGKSTSVKALLNEYYNEGLRIIEVYKHQFNCLPELIDKIKFRNYKFIIFMDDLSFEDFEIEYKYLKALIEGGIEPKPNNVLIYATSNRRHLIKETGGDRADADDRHKSDTVQEKLSLAERFGLTIYYPKPISKEYKEIVLHLARKEGVEMSEEELLKKAHVWGMEHGSLSGRIANQFITSLK